MKQYMRFSWDVLLFRPSVLDAYSFPPDKDDNKTVVQRKMFQTASSFAHVAQDYNIHPTNPLSDILGGMNEGRMPGEYPGI